MSRKRSQMQAYLAGIIDGEGCIGIFYANGTFQARVSIQMQNPESVLLFKQFYPEGKVTYRADRGLWAVVYSHLNAYNLLKEIKEFLIIKHNQAKLVLSFLTHRRRDHWQNKITNCERCRVMAERLKEVRSEDKGVKTVNALISHEMREYRAKPEEVAQDVQNMNAVMQEALEGVETKDRLSLAVEPMSAPEQEIVHAAG